MKQTESMGPPDVTKISLHKQNSKSYNKICDNGVQENSIIWDSENT